MRNTSRFAVGVALIFTSIWLATIIFGLFLAVYRAW